MMTLVLVATFLGVCVMALALLEPWRQSGQ